MISWRLSAFILSIQVIKLIYITLCDDDLLFAQTLQSQVRRSFEAHETDIAIDHCETASCLLHTLDTRPADLVFLDLSIGDDDGYALAEEIRRRHLNTEIVFVTNHPERMQDAFPFRPIGFLPKPPSDADIAATVDRFIHFYWQEGASYTVSSRDQDMRIPLRDILYFESSAHRVMIHRHSEEEPIHQIRRLDEIETELESTSFVRIHKSFLVHMDAISTVDRAHMRVVLTNGKDLPISRSRYAQVMDQFIHYRLR